MKFYYVPILKKKLHEIEKAKSLSFFFFFFFEGSKWKLILFFLPKKRMVDKVTHNAILGLGFQLWAKSNNN